MGICCTEDNYEYHEVEYSNNKIHYKCICGVCKSYVKFVKLEEIDKKIIKIPRPRSLF